MLAVNQLHYTRYDHDFYRGLSFCLPNSFFLQVMGQNGIGKTTLLKLLAGLLTPSSGEIIREAKCAYIGHEFGFTSWLTVKENLRFTAKLHHNNKDSIDELLDQFGLTPWQQCYPQALSAGLRRRLAFASLLLMRAKIWLLDEPFVSLDKNSVALIQSLIIQHLSLSGIVVMTTHQEMDWPIKVNRLLLKEDACAILLDVST